MKSSVSVIIPAYNCERSIGEALKSLGRQTYSSDIEVVVVDDGSSDETASVVQAYPGVRYLYQDNAGPATARNKGARAAQNAFLLFTDSDCVPQPDWVQRIVEGFHSRDIAAVAGSYGIANPESWLARSVHAEIRFRHKHLMPEYPRSFGSYNFGIRKDVFEAAGGFDERYKHASGEDNDLSYKVLNAGHKIFFVPQALVAHHHPVRVRKYLVEQFRHGFWRVRMYADHPHMAGGDDYTFWKDIIEVPLTLAVLGFLLFACVRVPWAGPGFILTAALLFLLQAYFGFRIVKKKNEAFFYTFVLFARAFSRLFGFSSGIWDFFIKKITK